MKLQGDKNTNDKFFQFFFPLGGCEVSPGGFLEDKMMKYELTRRRKTVYAKNPEELVTWLRKTDPELWINNEQYMKRYAEKLRKFTGLYVDETTEELFVNGLIEIGYIKPVEKTSFWDFFKTNKVIKNR